MKKWRISFNENGDEYMGYLIVTAFVAKMTGTNTFIADGVEIEIDEPIIAIEDEDVYKKDGMRVP